MTMKKRLSFGFLLTNWIIGLFFIFLLQPSANAAPSFEGKSHLQTHKEVISESLSLPEAPSFEVDLKLFLPSSGFKNPGSYSNSSVAQVPFSEYTTVPFFDVKQTFIHFFFTW